MEVVKFGLGTITEPVVNEFSAAVNQERTNSEGTKELSGVYGVFPILDEISLSVITQDEFVQTKPQGICSIIPRQEEESYFSGTDFYDSSEMPLHTHIYIYLLPESFP